MLLVLAVASLVSAAPVAFVAYFSGVARVSCVKKVRKGPALRVLRWMETML